MVGMTEGGYGHLTVSQMRELKKLLDRLSEDQTEQVVEWLRLANERRYDDPEPPMAAAPVPARIPPRPRTGAPGVALIPESDPTFEEIIEVSPV
jgi:hypothetical protein